MTADDARWSQAETARFEQFAEESFSWRCIEEPALRSLLAPRVSAATTALDLGCGGGRTIDLLRRLGVREEAICGIDSNAALIDVARRKHPRAQLACRDISDVPYDINWPARRRGLWRRRPAAGIVVAHFVLQYLSRDDLMKCLAEVRRLLEPAGYLAIGLAHPVRVARQAGASYFDRTRHRIPAPWGGHTVSAGLPVSDYLNCIIAAGFTLRQIEEPEICPSCGDEPDARNYAGPTRLLILAQA